MGISSIIKKGYLFRYTEDTESFAEGFTENRESTKSIYSFSLSVLCANSVFSVSGLNRYVVSTLSQIPTQVTVTVACFD